MADVPADTGLGSSGSYLGGITCLDIDSDGRVQVSPLNIFISTKEIGYRIKKALEEGDLGKFGLLLHKHWMNKKQPAEVMMCYRTDYLSNMSELTARINDEGWETSISNWLKGSRINANDLVFVFSVGGGDKERRISQNLVEAVKLAKEVGAKVVGIQGNFHCGPII